MKQISGCDLPRSETFEGKVPRKGMTMERRSRVPRRVPRELCSITREYGSSIFGWSSKLGMVVPLSSKPNPFSGRRLLGPAQRPPSHLAP